MGVIAHDYAKIIKRTGQTLYPMPRWDSLARERQAELCRLTRPWTRSCGPRSEYGRRVSSQNAKKHRRRFQVAGCDMVQEPEKRGDTLQVAARAKYTGSDPAIASICCEKKLEIFAMHEGWAVCWVPDFPGLVTVPIGELEQIDAEMDVRGQSRASPKDS